MQITATPASQRCSEDGPRRHSNAQHHARLPADAQHTPLPTRLGSGDAGETDEGNFPRKHGCGDAQLENKCSQNGIQSPTHSSASEIKNDRAHSAETLTSAGLSPQTNHREAWDWPLRSPLALDINRTSQPSVSPEPVVCVCHSPQGGTSTQCSVFGFTWSVLFPPTCF